MTPSTVLLIGSHYPPDEKDFRIPGIGDTEAVNQRARDRCKEATKAYNEKQKPRFDAACQALGAAFARRHWRIMVGVPFWEQWTNRQTVAPFVLAGANSEKPDEATGPHPVVFYAPREPEKPSHDGPVGTLQQLKLSHPNVKLEYKLVAQGQYKAKLIPNVTAVDAVVLVAGSDGTASIGYAAYSLERPVIAVAGFGGAAKDMLDDVLFDTYDRYKESVQLTDGELLSLTAAWNDKADEAANRATADSVVSAAEKLVKAYALAGRRTTRVLKGAMVGMAVLLSLWVTIFLRGATLTAPETPPASNAPAANAAGTSGAATDSVKPAAPAATKSDATNTAATAQPAPVGANKAGSKSAGVAKGDDLTAKASGSKGETKGSGNATPPPPTTTPAKAWIPFAPVAFFLLLFISAAVGTGLRVLAAFQRNELTRLTGFAVGLELVVALSVAFGLALFYLIGSISFTGEVSMLVSNAQKFPMVAVSMSLLGLAAGYLVPLDKLRDRLQKIVAEQKK